MIVAEMPFEPFLQMIRKCGARNGFALLAILVARHADCPWAFEEINRSWSSLHDLTGSNLLLLTLDAKNSSPIAGWDLGCRLNDSAGRVHGNHGVVAFASQFRLMQTLDAPEIDNVVRPWSHLTDQEFVEAHVRERERVDGWEDDHTLGISAAVQSLDALRETDIPCIYFELLRDNSSVNVPLPRHSNGKSIYDGFKSLVSRHAGHFTQLHELQSEASALNERIKQISGSSSSLKHSLQSSQWLTDWLVQTQDLPPAIRSFVESCLAGHGSTKDVYKVIQPLISELSREEFSALRSHLNRLCATQFSNAKAHALHQSILSNQEKQESVSQIVRQGILDSFALSRGKGDAPQPSKRFEIALSFPGELRFYVEQVAEELARVRGKKSIFYDNYHQADLARPNLDVHLLDIYRNKSEVVVVFLCEDYQKKDWCGLESRAVRDLIKNRADDSIVIVRLGGGRVDGFLSIDGYIDGEQHTPIAVAEFILQRLERT